MWVGSSFAGMPRLLHVVVAMVLATLAGAVWAGIAGLLKAVAGAHEVISTIMLNWIAVWVGAYLFQLNGPLQNSDPSQQSVPVSSDVAASAKLPVFWGDPELQGLHIGIFIALAAAVVFWVLLNRSTTGYEVRAVGFNPEAARYGGISVSRNYILVMAVCGAFAGLAGSVDLLGWQFHIATNDILNSANVGLGFFGIAVALLGRNTASGTVVAALLFGALLTGTSQRNLDPTIFEPELAGNLTLIIQGLVVLIVSADVIVLTMLRRGRAIFRRGTPAAPAAPAPPPRRRPREHRGRHLSAPAPAAGAPRGLGRHRAGLRRLVHHAPPALVRTPVPSILIGLLAMTAGAWAIGGDEKRLGWGAIAAGIVGGAGAVAATQSGTGNLEDVVAWSALIAATLRYATPLIFGALGGIISERSGVVNVGLEGMMLMGAFFGIFGADLLDSWFLGLLVGMAAGGVLALVHAFFSVALRADQIVSGIALNFLALGVTGYVFLDHYGDQGTPDNIPRVPDISIPGVKNLSFFGDAIGHANTLTWVALILVVALTVFLFRTPRGLRLRSVGEHPRAAETVGISVPRTRYFAVVASGMLAAMGGAYLSIGFVGSFNQGMTAGRGFIALAAVIFGKWHPVGALGAALLFGFSTALAQRLPAFSPSTAVLFQALPYVLTLIAVAGVIGRSRPPAAVGQPYVKE